MKTLVVYVIWNKHDMVRWICEGIIKSFPKETDIYFLLDDPIDGTDDVFEEDVPKWLNGYKIKVDIFGKKSFKYELLNIALEYGLANGYDWIICPQDDQKIQDPYLLNDLSKFKEPIGLIGGRDGFWKLDYKNATGSMFSVPTGENYRYLRPGEYTEVKYLNDGPLIYHRSTIEKIGFHDLGFKVFMSEVDYCERCFRAGLPNINLGMYLAHEKFGTLRTNFHYKKHDYSKLDNDYFHAKWG